VPHCLVWADKGTTSCYHDSVIAAMRMAAERDDLYFNVGKWKREMSIFGVGPRIMGTALWYAIVAGLATWLWPDVCLVRAIPYQVFVAVGVLLLLIGIPMLAVAGRAVHIAHKSDKLATTGFFGVVRNPIYSAWIVFVIPGLVLLTHSWPLFLTPLVAYVAFKATIWREYEYLERQFGDAFRQYTAQVNELFPFPRWK
jgi:protein-S-isoprenylcysteine O-methyltransferase Ste14